MGAVFVVVARCRRELAEPCARYRQDIRLQAVCIRDIFVAMCCIDMYNFHAGRQ